MSQSERTQDKYVANNLRSPPATGDYCRVPQDQFEGYTRNRVFTIIPADADAEALLDQWIGIDERHAVYLEECR